MGNSYYIDLERLKQEKSANSGITTNFNAPCNAHLHRLGPHIAKELIDQMADKRLKAKMAKLAGAGRVDIEHALFAGRARALGYSRFKENFTKIATAAPLSLVALELKAINPEHRVVAAQAVYLGMAGFFRSVYRVWQGRGVHRIFPIAKMHVG